MIYNSKMLILYYLIKKNKIFISLLWEIVHLFGENVFFKVTIPCSCQLIIEHMLRWEKGTMMTSTIMTSSTRAKDTEYIFVSCTPSSLLELFDVLSTLQ